MPIGPSMLRYATTTSALCGCLLAIAFLGGAGAAVRQARLLPNGQAVPPPSAPATVKLMIEAANHIRHRPYLWGGGHRAWRSRGYDCSGSVSYVLHAAGLLDSPLDSRGFMRWGAGGPGSWVRIYASPDHVFAVIAGLRWDTSMTTEGDGNGPGWSEAPRSTRGFRLRHPLGHRAGWPTVAAVVLAG